MYVRARIAVVPIVCVSVRTCDYGVLIENMTLCRRNVKNRVKDFDDRRSPTRDTRCIVIYCDVAQRTVEFNRRFSGNRPETKLKDKIRINKLTTILPRVPTDDRV